MQESDSEQSALDAQQELVESSLELVFETFDDALKSSVEQPVVILLDCEDSVGGEIARSWLGSAAVDQAVADRHEEEAEPSLAETTVFAYAFPFKKCMQEMPAFFPYLDPIWRQPYPDSGFLTIGITSGGASVLTVPFDARP